MTAALHALILFIFYLLIPGFGYPGLVVFQQYNIFLIKNQYQEPYTSSKQQERHNKNTVLKSLENLLVAEADSHCVPAATPRCTSSAPRSVISKKGAYGHKEGGHRREDGARGTSNASIW